MTPERGPLPPLTIEQKMWCDDKARDAVKAGKSINGMAEDVLREGIAIGAAAEVLRSKSQLQFDRVERVARLAGQAVPYDVQRAVEQTRQDLGPTGSNYPAIRLMLLYLETRIANAREALGVIATPLDEVSGGACRPSWGAIEPDQP